MGDSTREGTAGDWVFHAEEHRATGDQGRGLEGPEPKAGMLVKELRRQGVGLLGRGLGLQRGRSRPGTEGSVLVSGGSCMRGNHGLWKGSTHPRESHVTPAQSHSSSFSRESPKDCSTEHFRVWDHTRPA